MLRKLVIGALGAMTLMFSTTAFAQGTEADAKAMLAKTIAALHADKAKTLDMINKGEGGFLQGDIYPFCANVSDDKIVAIGNPDAKGMIGTDARTLVDAWGKAYGKEMYDLALAEPQEKPVVVTYMFPKPGTKTPVEKVSFVTSVGRGVDLICGVGYYK